MSDSIKHPEHYTKYRTEVIEITRYLPFCLGNVVKYVLRAPYKGGVDDCDKAMTYLAWCDPSPLQIAICNVPDLRQNLRSYIHELRQEAVSNEIAGVQADILACLGWVIENGQYSCMIKLIRKLRDLLVRT